MISIAKAPRWRIALIVCFAAAVTFTALNLSGSLRAADTRLRPESGQLEQADVPEAQPHATPPTVTCAPTRLSLSGARLETVHVVERSGANLGSEGVHREAQEIVFEIANWSDSPITAMLIGVSDPKSNVEWIIDSGDNKDGAEPVIPARDNLTYRVPRRALAMGRYSNYEPCSLQMALRMVSPLG